VLGQLFEEPDVRLSEELVDLVVREDQLRGGGVRKGFVDVNRNLIDRCTFSNMLQISTLYVIIQVWGKTVILEKKHIWENMLHLWKYIISEEIQYIWGNTYIWGKTLYPGKYIISWETHFWENTLYLGEVHYIWGNTLYLGKYITSGEIRYIWGNTQYLGKYIIPKGIHCTT